MKEIDIENDKGLLNVDILEIVHRNDGCTIDTIMNDYEQRFNFDSKSMMVLRELVLKSLYRLVVFHYIRMVSENIWITEYGTKLLEKVILSRWNIQNNRSDQPQI